MNNIRWTYSLRFLLTLVLVCSAIFGSAAIYKSVWKNHCKRLEPSLFSFILKEQIKIDLVDPPVFLAIGHPATEDWASLSLPILNQIGLENIQSINERNEHESLIFFDVQWVDWSTVVVSYGEFECIKQCNGFDNSVFRYEEGKWKLVKQGIRWQTSM